MDGKEVGIFGPENGMKVTIAKIDRKQPAFGGLLALSCLSTWLGATLVHANIGLRVAPKGEPGHCMPLFTLMR